MNSLEEDFDVASPLSPAQVWTVVRDISRIAPLVPGAELTEVADEKIYRGKISVLAGFAFAGVMEFAKDPANHTAQITAQGADAEGRGTAHASVLFRIEPIGGGCKVRIHLELMLSGRAAQWPVNLVLPEKAERIVRQLAANLRAEIAGR